MTAGVLLAAGESRRMGESLKLLLPAGGEPLVRHAARALLDAGLSPVVAVVGYRAPEVAKALAGLPLECVTNPRFARGMGTSLAAGVGALPAAAEVAVIALGDMPAVRPDTIRTLLRDRRESGIAVPLCQGRRGHPVVFDLTRYRNQLLALDGDLGARAILAAHPEDVARVPVEDPGVLLDLDTRGEYEAWMWESDPGGGGEA